MALVQCLALLVLSMLRLLSIVSGEWGSDLPSVRQVIVMCRGHRSSSIQSCAITKIPIKQESFFYVAFSFSRSLIADSFYLGDYFCFSDHGHGNIRPFLDFLLSASLLAALPFYRLQSGNIQRVNLWALSIKSSAEVSDKDRNLIFWCSVFLGVIMFIGSALQQVSLGITSVANTAFLTTLYVPLVPIFGFVLFQKNIAKWRWLAVGIFVAGSWMMSGVSPKEAVIGDIMVIIRAIFWALHIMLVGWLAQRTNAPFSLLLCRQ